MVNNTSKEAEMPGMHAGAEGGLRVEVDYGQSVRLPRVSGLYQAEAALKPICIAAVTGPMFHNTQAVCHSMPSQHTPSQSLPPFIQPYIHPSVLPLTFPPSLHSAIYPSVGPSTHCVLFELL